MRTRLAAWVVAAAALLLLLGLVTQDGRFVLLVLPLLVYLALGTILGPPLSRVRVVRQLEREVAYEGEEVTVALRVENRGPALELLEVYDPPPPGLSLVRGSNYLVTPLGREETREWDYTVFVESKGRYELGPVLLRSRDLTDFFVHETTAGERDTLVAAPRREELERIPLRTERPRPWLGQIPSRMPGMGTDFWSIRAYAGGDELRRMNWKASARLGDLFTNELEAERVGDFVVVLDARGEVAGTRVPEEAVEMGVRGALSLAAKLLEEKNRVGLVVLRNVLDWVYPGYGRRQLHRILDSLVRVRPGGQWTLHHLPLVLGRFFPAGSRLLILSPTVDLGTLKAVLELRARGFEVLVISPDALEFERRQVPRGPVGETAHALLALERRAYLALLMRRAPVVDWKPDEPLAVPLLEVERRRLRAR